MFDAEHKQVQELETTLSDNASQDKVNWKHLLRHCESQTEPISYPLLSNMNFGNSTGWDPSLDLWNFISKRLGTDLYEKRIQLAHGVDGNGFELWRRLCQDYEGGKRWWRTTAAHDFRTSRKSPTSQTSVPSWTTGKI